MRFRNLLFLVAICLGLAAGQYLETVIPLPDSIGSVWGIYHLAWDSSGSELYVGGHGGVVLVDAESFGRVARVLDAESIMDVCPARELNKIYCADRARGEVWVIDCEADSVVAVVPVGLKLWFLCYSPQSQKVYCTGDDSVAVAIDATADTVVAVIQFSRYASSMCHVPSDNELYVRSNGGVQVVDCATDSVVGKVAGAPYSVNFHFYAPTNKVYAGMSSCLYVIDCVRDSVIAAFPTHRARSFCSDLTRNRVYCAHDSGLVVVDAMSDTVVYRLTLPLVRGAVYDSARSRLYVSSTSEGLVVVDVEERRIVATVKTVSNPGAVFADPQRGRVLCTDLMGGAIAVDMDSAAVVGVMLLGAGSTTAVFNHVDNKLYYLDAALRYTPTGVIDGARNRPLPALPAEPQPRGLSWSPRGDKLFLKLEHDTTDLVVYDCTADTVVNRIDLAPFRAQSYEVCLDTLRNKLYLSGYLGDDRALGVVDCAGESLLTALRLPGYVYAMALADQHGKLYCWCSVHRLVVIDCSTDSIISCNPSPNPSRVETSVAYSPEDAAVFFTGDGRLYRLDVLSDTVTAWIQWPNPWPCLQYVPRYRKLYWFLPGYRCDSVLVIDPEAISVMNRLTVGFGTISTSVDHTGRYLYSASNDNRVWVTDCEVDSVVAVVDLGERPLSGRLTFNPCDRRMYLTQCGEWDVIPVIKCESPGGAEESGQPPKARRQPTIARGILRVGLPLTANSSQPDGGLYDASGRRVLSLQPGPNDVRRLAPGVYFVKDPGGSTLSKVVLTR